jgi:hypothetical protein
MDFLCILVGSCRLRYGSQHHIVHSVHKFLSMGPYICSLSMLCFLGTLCLGHILVDKLCMDLLGIQLGMYKCRLSIVRWNHREMDHMDYLLLVLQL